MSIRKICEQTRLWSERYGRAVGYASDLEGMCAMASLVLFDRLRAAGHSPQLAVWGGCDAYINHPEYPTQGHAYVVLNDLLLDITATQFGQKPVEIRRRLKIPARAFYWENRHTRYYETESRFVRFVLSNGAHIDEIYPAPSLAFGCRLR